MKYRALAVGVTQNGVPLQNFSHNEGSLLKWARMIAESHKCPVKIFIWEERLVQTVEPPVDATMKYTVK